MSTRKFYKTTYEVVVLSDVELDGEPNLEELNFLITDGGCSGTVAQTACAELTGKEAAEALISQGSSPEFFNLTDDGEDDGED